MITRVLLVVACVLILISGVMMNGLSTFELSEHAQQTLSFSLGA